MIRDSELGTVANKISHWIKQQIDSAGAKSAVVGLSGGADSALVAILCQSVVPTYVVRMPCHSSDSSLDRAWELITRFEKLIELHVDLETAFSSIQEQVDHSLAWPTQLAETGALRSCLRAPTLDYVAKRVNGLVVGTGNRDEDEVTRYFQKRGDGAVDISPIAKLHKSEVYQLLKFLNCPSSIVDAVPTADLWGPEAGQEDEKELGLTYQEIEWAIRFSETNDFMKIGLSYSALYGKVNGSDLLALTSRQLEVLKKVAQLEKISRHKASLPPVYDIRNEDNLGNTHGPKFKLFY